MYHDGKELNKLSIEERKKISDLYWAGRKLKLSGEPLPKKSNYWFQVGYYSAVNPERK